MKDEFTSEMHNEMRVPEDTEVSHRVHTVLTAVHYKIFTLKKALEFYNVTKEQFDLYKDSWSPIE